MYGVIFRFGIEIVIFLDFFLDFGGGGWYKDSRKFMVISLLS